MVVFQYSGFSNSMLSEENERVRDLGATGLFIWNEAVRY